MQDRVGALEAALETSASNERAILDVWGGDPLQQLLANLEAQRTVRALSTEMLYLSRVHCVMDRPADQPRRDRRIFSAQ